MKILVVEDEQAIAKNIAEYLRGHDFNVDLAFDGTTGWEKIRKTKYDVILLDWMLPGMDGLQILAMTRREFPDRSILMLTAKDTLDDKVSGLNVGADDYIVKPFQLKEVLARIQAILRRRAKTPPKRLILKIADLTLDPQTQLVKRGGKDIKLTKKLFQILEFLMRNPERVIPKSELEETLWDSEAELWSDVVRSHIQKLREKVDKGHDKPLIHTVHGIGYKFSATTQD
jgi:DNA-binding response OmpR family regulator